MGYQIVAGSGIRANQWLLACFNFNNGPVL